jgi:hypothetical protein
MKRAELVRTVAWRRLRARRGTVFALVTLLGVSVVLLALALASAIRPLLFDPGFPEVRTLWLVQLAGPGAYFDESGLAAQYSFRIAARFVEERGPFDQVGKAQLQHVAVTALDGRGGGETPGSVPAVQVDSGWWAVVRPPLQAGRLPSADSAQVVISATAAGNWFGGAEAALGRQILAGDQRVQVVGVLAHGLRLPAPGAFLRDSRFLAEIYFTSDDPLLGVPAARADASGEWLLVARSGRAHAQLEQATRAWLDAELGGRGERARAAVVPLRAAMLGHAPQVGLILLAASLLMCFAAWLACSLFLSAQFALRRAGHGVLHALGVPDAGLGDFERGEVLFLLAGASVAATVLLALLQAVALANPQAVPWLIGIDGGQVWVALLLVLAALAVLLTGLARRAAGRQAAARSLVPRKAAGSRLAGAALKLLQSGQAVLAMLIASLLMVSLGPLLTTASALLGRDLERVLELRLDFPAGSDASLASVVLEEVARDIGRLPAIRRVAISTVPILELAPVGQAVDDRFVQSYHGPRDWDGAAILGRDPRGGLIYRLPEARGATIEEIRYVVFTPQVEPAFFDILGLELRGGRLFAAGASGEVVLTPAAARTLFGGHEAWLGARLPAPLADTEDAVWHHGVVAVGKVEARPLGGLLQRELPGFGAAVVAFLPYTGLSWQDRQQAHSAFLAIELNAGVDWGPAMRAIAEPVRARELDFEFRRAAQAVRSMAASQFMDTLLLAVLAMTVLVAVALGAAGTARLEIERRQSELATRLALGADEVQLFRAIARRQVIAPLVLASIWVLAGVVLAALPVNAPDGWAAASTAAAAGVLAVLAAGLWSGLLPILGPSLLRNLRSE